MVGLRRCGAVSGGVRLVEWSFTSNLLTLYGKYYILDILWAYITVQLRRSITIFGMETDRIMHEWNMLYETVRRGRWAWGAAQLKALTAFLYGNARCCLWLKVSSVLASWAALHVFDVKQPNRNNLQTCIIPKSN